MLHFGVGAFAAPCIGGGFEAFHAYGGNEVLHAQHVLTEVLVDERGISEREERAVGVVLAQLNKVAFAHERFAACVDVHVGS